MSIQASGYIAACDKCSIKMTTNEYLVGDHVLVFRDHEQIRTQLEKLRSKGWGGNVGQGVILCPACNVELQQIREAKRELTSSYTKGVDK